MQSPIVAFMNWLKSIDNGQGETIAFLALDSYPHFDRSTTDLSGSQITALESFANTITDYTMITGLALYLNAAVSFIVDDYDDMETALGFRDNIASSITKFRKQGLSTDFLEQKHKQSAEEFYARKSVKESWENFKDAYFNFKTIRAYNGLMGIEAMKNIRR